MDASVQSSISKYGHDRIVTGRIDVVCGPTGRRRWPDEVKGRIVAESFAGNEPASSVARRHGIVPSQLFGWRRQAREGKLALPADDDTLFAPVLVETEANAPPMPSAVSGMIEIDAGGVTLRLSPDTPAPRIAEIVQALRGAA